MTPQAPIDSIAASLGEAGVSLGLGAVALAMLGYLFRSYWKQSGYWEQLTSAARTSESLARADASAARAEAAAAYAEAHAARISAERAQDAFEHCEEGHAATRAELDVTRKRLALLEERLRDLGIDV